MFRYAVLPFLMWVGFATQGTTAQPLTQGDFRNDPPQRMAERIFGHVAHSVDEVVQANRNVGYLSGMIFYEKPRLFLNICEARAYEVELSGNTGGDEDKAILHFTKEDVYDVYYMPDSPGAGCGRVGGHAAFRAENVEDAGAAVSLLQAVTAAATSDKPLAFPIWDRCRSPDPHCEATGLRAQLARLKITDLRKVARLQWLDASGNLHAAFNLSAGSDRDGHWQMQVDESEHIAPIPAHNFEIHGVHMDWIDSRPIP